MFQLCGKLKKGNLPQVLINEALCKERRKKQIRTPQRRGNKKIYILVLHLASRHPKPTAPPTPASLPPRAAGPFWTSPEGPNMSSAAPDLLLCQTPLIVSGTAAAVRSRLHHSERRWDIKTSFPLGVGVGVGVEEITEDMVAAHLLIKTS